MQKWLNQTVNSHLLSNLELFLIHRMSPQKLFGINIPNTFRPTHCSSQNKNTNRRAGFAQPASSQRKAAAAERPVLSESSSVLIGRGAAARHGRIERGFWFWELKLIHFISGYQGRNFYKDFWKCSEVSSNKNRKEVVKGKYWSQNKFHFF